MADVLVEQAQHLPGTPRRRPRESPPLHGPVQPQPQPRGHTQHPVVASQALVVGRKRPSDAEYLHKSQGRKQCEHPVERLARRRADQVARCEHERRCARRREHAQPQSRRQRPAVVPEERPHPRVVAHRAPPSAAGRLAHDLLRLSRHRSSPPPSCNARRANGDPGPAARSCSGVPS